MRRLACVLALLVFCVPTFAQITVVNSASFEELRPLAPGSIAAAFGSFDGATPVTATSLPLPTQLGGVEVRVEGVSAPLYAVTTTQVNFQIPPETPAGIDRKTIRAEFYVQGVPVGEAGLPLRDVSPVLFTANAQDPARPALALNGDGTVNSAERPARPGETMRLFAAGQGAKFISPQEIFPPRTTVEPLVYFRTWEGETSASLLPVETPGLWRVDVRVPQIEPPPDGPTPVSIAIDGVSSNTVSVWISP